MIACGSGAAKMHRGRESFTVPNGNEGRDLELNHLTNEIFRCPEFRDP